MNILKIMASIAGQGGKFRKVTTEYKVKDGDLADKTLSGKVTKTTEYVAQLGSHYGNTKICASINGADSPKKPSTTKWLKGFENAISIKRDETGAITKYFLWVYALKDTIKSTYTLDSGSSGDKGWAIANNVVKPTSHKDYGNAEILMTIDIANIKSIS